MSILVSNKTNNECFHSCNDKNIFIRWKMECSNRLGTFHFSPHENVLTITLIELHYLCTIAL